MPRSDAAAVARARSLVETTARTQEDIAREIGVSTQTLRTWSLKGGWRRHAGAPRAVPKLPPEKEGPARRLHEGGAAPGDLAALLGCTEGYVHQLAKRRGWARREAPAGRAPLRPEFARIAQALRQPGLTRGGYVKLVERALELILLDALESGDARLDHRVETLARLAKIAPAFPEAEPPMDGEECACRRPIDAGALRAELARRFAAFGRQAEAKAEAAEAAHEAADLMGLS